MSDFHTELMGKCYALVDDKLDLSDFRVWFASQLASGAAKAASSHDPHPTPSKRFTDYVSHAVDDYDPKMAEHHRKLMGSGDPE